MQVAPYMGAWIETWRVSRYSTSGHVSRPIWVRGLKQLTLMDGTCDRVRSRPIWVRGLKRALFGVHYGLQLSRALYGCVD